MTKNNLNLYVLNIKLFASSEHSDCKNWLGYMVPKIHCEKNHYITFLSFKNRLDIIVITLVATTARLTFLTMYSSKTSKLIGSI